MAEANTRSPTLSVCCLTRGPTARVAAQLRLLRPIAEEIVVALDTSVEENLAWPLEDVADVLVRYPYRDPVDRPVGWVHSLCTADWIFWIDDDEIPSAALLLELPGVIAAGDVTHGFVPRRTLWRDARTTLAETPWTTDYQLRLIANDPRLLWFPGITHWPIQAVGPHRYLEAPLYHTDLLLNPVERRREKVRRYEAAVPGRRVAGLPMNVAFFLPEERPEVETAAIPGEDGDTLERILAGEPWPDAAPASQSLRVATRDEIDACWHGAPADESTHQSTLTLVGKLDPFAAGEIRDVTVRVENRGNRTWPWGSLGSPRIAVSYRWLSPSGDVLVADGLRTSLPSPIVPGGSALVAASVLAPSEPGRLVLALDLLHEHVRWFGSALAQEVEVRPAPRVAVLAADDGQAAEVAAVLTDISPGVVPVVLTREPEDANVRLGYEAAPDGASYLHFGPPRGRLAGRARLLRRTAALEADALLVRGGRRPLMSDGASGFLDALSSTDALLVVDTGDGGRLEEWHRRAAMLAARLAGVPVIVVSDAEPAAIGAAIGALRDVLR